MPWPHKTVHCLEELEEEVEIPDQSGKLKKSYKNEAEAFMAQHVVGMFVDGGAALHEIGLLGKRCIELISNWAPGRRIRNNPN